MTAAAAAAAVDEEVWLDSDDWEEEARLGGFAAWVRWLRDDVRVQAVAWFVSTLAVFGPENSWAIWPGLCDWFWQSAIVSQLLLGWIAATLLTLGWATGRVQLVFTFEQRAMTFPPWSVLVFCKFGHPEVGSVIFFDGCDGWSYVRRVSSVKQVPNEGRYVQTTGDIPGAPDDKPLYSSDGCLSWLSPPHVRGTMVAGPVSLQVMVGLVITCLAVSPAATLAFLATNQPFLSAWVSLLLRFIVVLLANGLA